MTPGTPDRARLDRILFPYSAARAREAREAGRRFVYYTSAETAASILGKRQIWMRSTLGMNDYMEVEHGFECLNMAYVGETRKALDEALDACHAGLATELRDYFYGWLPGIRTDTYIACVSEHLEGEDQHGRLSMWRAYGGPAGVALVLNGAVMFDESDVLGAYASPVAYLGREAFAAEFGKIIENLKGEAEYLKSLDRDAVKNYAFNMLRFSVLCTKHPGFHEEREWRIIASPQMHGDRLPKPVIEVVRGTPQAVLKIDLKNQPDKGLVGLELPELLNRIIIGPCEFPAVVFSAFVKLLTEAGVPEPAKRITISDIPLRQPT
ncbi:MAG: DUF2971 domain-containing protein [Candidatus Rokuibacteriota bacterium]